MKTPITKSHEEYVTEALLGLLGATNAANQAACSFNNEVISHKKSLISEATIIRETSTLLLHATENLARITLASLKNTEIRETVQST